MNTFYSKTLLYILFFLFIIIDSINGYLQDAMNIYTPIGLISRGIILLLVSRFLFFPRNSFLYRLFGIVFYIYIIALVVWTIRGQIVDYYKEFQYLFRFIYFFAIVSYFNVYEKTFSIKDLCSIIVYSSLIIALMNIICIITGIGNRSYGENFGFGMKAFYTDGNSLGLYMILSNCISIWFAFIKKGKMFLIAVIISIGTLLIGSRSAIIGVFISWPLLLGYILFCKDKNIVISKLNKYFILVFGGCGLLYLFIMMYKQISENDAYTIEKFTFESAVSARDHLIILGKQIISEFNSTEVFFGKGYSAGLKSLGNLHSYDVEFKSMESDWYDQILYFGWFLGGLMIILSMIIFFKFIYVYLKYPSTLSFSLFIIACLWMASSWMAGHAFNNTMLAPLFGVFCVIEKKIILQHENRINN